MTDPPFSKAVLLYSSAKFSCKGTGDGLIWTVEHITLNDTELEERSIVIETKNINSNLSSILIIPALPANDGIEIGCIIFVTTPHFMTAGAKEAVLTVNGYSCCFQVVKSCEIWHELSLCFRCVTSRKYQMVF